MILLDGATYALKLMLGFPSFLFLPLLVVLLKKIERNQQWQDSNPQLPGFIQVHKPKGPQFPAKMELRYKVK